MKTYLRLFGMVILLLFAFGFRVYDFAGVPPGLQEDDERWNLEIIDQVQRGEYRLFYKTGWGREGGYYYVAALWEGVFGENYLALRLLSVFAGTLSVALLFRLSRAMFGWQTGWISAAGMSCSMWPLFYSRIIFRVVLLLPMLLGALNLLWNALTHTQRSDPPQRMWMRWIGIGMLLTGSVYTYTSARILPILIVLICVLALLHHRMPRTGHARWAAVAGFGVAALLLLPLLWALVTLESIERFEQVGGPLDALTKGDASLIVHESLNTLGMFFVRGNHSWRYNWVGRPIFDPVAGALFTLGIVLSLRHSKSFANAILMLWWLIGLVPGFVSFGSPSTVRTIMSMPVTYIFPALALREIERWLGQRGLRQGRILVVLLAVLYLGLSGVRTWRDYFVRWPQHPQVREIYQSTLTEATRYAEHQGQVLPVAMSGVLAGNRDPYSVRHIRRSRDWLPRWFDGRYALLLPAGDEFLLVVPEYVPLSQPLEDLLLPVADVWHNPSRTQDGRPTFVSYSSDQAKVLQSVDPGGLRVVRWGALEIGDIVEYTSLPSTSLPIQADAFVQFQGYVQLAEPSPGTGLDVLTLWQVVSASDADWVAFVHLVNGKGEWVSGYDRLDIESGSSREGDLVVQMHRLSIPADLAPGLYTLRAGIYERNTMARLMWQVDPSEKVDHLILAALNWR